MKDHKKSHVKLHLDRETIRNLARAELREVQGGGSLYPCSLGPPAELGCCSNAAATATTA